MRMGAKQMTLEQYDNIFLMKSSGITTDAVRKIVGCSDAQVKAVMQIAKAAQAGDIETLARLRETRPRLVDWACNKFNVKLEQPLEPEEAAAPDNDNTALAFGKLIESIDALTKEVRAIDNRLSAMQLTQQGFRGDMQQSINKVIETINVNGDIITKEHNRAIDLLGGIKCNTRKRGSNDAV